MSFFNRKHNVYNIYVAINVPSFYKTAVRAFFHTFNLFVSVTAGALFK